MTRGGSSRKGKPSGSKSVYPDVEPGYNARAVEFLRAIRPQGKIDKTDVDALRARFEHYLDMCAQYDFKVSNLNAYAAMGITRVDASLFSRDARHPERAEFIQQVQDYCSGYRECLMSDGKCIRPLGSSGRKTMTECAILSNTSPHRRLELPRISQKSQNAMLIRKPQKA